MARLARRAASWCGGDRLAVNCAGMEGQRDPVSRLLYTLTGFSAANYYKTPVNGSEPGVAPFGSVLLFRVTAISGAVRLLRAVVSANAGWQQVIYTNGIGANYGTGAGYPDTGRYAITATDLGKLIVFVSWIDGSLARAWRRRRT